MRSLPIILMFLAACGGGSGMAPALPLQPPSGVTTISDIQGNRSSSPFVAQAVSITGIVTGDFQDNDADDTSNLGGFYLQDETPDGDPSTSDGIFVFDGRNPSIDVRVGDRVAVHGAVSEYYGETQITEPTVDVVGSGSIQATDVILPAARTMSNIDNELLADLERYEGMLIRLPQTLSVTNLRNLEAFGAVGLSEGGRLYQFTNANAPDRRGYAAHKTLNAQRSIELDDGRRSTHPKPIRYLQAGPTPAYSIRMGDTITGVTGNLRYSRGSGGRGDESWRLMPTTDPEFDSANPRPGKPSVGGSLRVASFNADNFFSTVDSGRRVCGPRRDDSCRGADSAEELRRQRAKIASALAMMDADIVGLIELENNGSTSLQLIIDALNDLVGSNEYAFLSTGTIHSDAIKTGFVYKPSTVTLLGEFALLDQDIDRRFNDARNRPTLAQTFEVNATGAVFTVIVNHLKSKGSSCDNDGDPNLDDGQANCNRTRTDAAAAIADWLATDPTGSNDADFLIIGDLNAYVQEDPLTALKMAGFTNLIETQDNPYSFMFDAQAGALDHAVASARLAPQVVEAIEWHINADEPPVLDYNLENSRDPSLFSGDDPYRASDHDPIIVGLDLVN